jgi:dihydrofolate synthase / folylpolyglutamate synthase
MGTFRLPKQVENYDELMDMFTAGRSNDWINHSTLEYFHHILNLIGDPQKEIGNIVHVTGTNGKGSVSWKVARSVEEHLKEQEAKVGLYVSPDIYGFEERISINGECISQDDMVKYTNIVLERLYGHSGDENEEHDSFRLGMVGIMVCIAFLYFHDKGVDYSVIEGGIGIKMDHTNVVSPAVSVMTSIGLDHVPILGTTVEEIADDKAYIIKGGAPVVIGPRIRATGDCLAVIIDRAIKQGLTTDQIFEVRNSASATFESDNQATAKEALYLLLGPDYRPTETIFSSPPGRYHNVTCALSDQEMPCVFDVGHNPDAFRATFSRCAEDFPGHEIILVCGVNAARSLQESCEVINEDLPGLSHVVLYPQPGKLHPPEEVKPCLREGLEVENYAELESINDRLSKIAEASDKKVCVVVIGSFYVVGGVSRGMGIDLSELENRHRIMPEASSVKVSEMFERPRSAEDDVSSEHGASYG